MTKEKSLAEKIKSYSTLALSILATTEAANAQVIYTDVNPDTTVQSNGTYGLDLNNDGVTDFNLVQFNGSGADGVAITPIQSNAFANSSVTIGPYTVPSPDTLNFGDTIDVNLNWQQIVPATSTSSGAASSTFILGLNFPQFTITGGNWFNAGEHYLGLKFKIGTVDYYGWARLELSEGATQFTLKDYAYYAESNKLILAGQQFSDAVTEINKSENQLLKLFVADNKLSIHILNNEIIGGKVEVLNTEGQIVSVSEISKNEFALDLKMLPSGLYFIRAGKNEKQQTNKILIHR